MYIILCPCDSFHHYSQPIEEFSKRLGKKLEIVLIKPSKKKTPAEIILDETAKITIELAKYPQAQKLVLDPDGKPYSTLNFYRLLEKSKMQFGKTVFVIGGSYGLDYDLLRPHLDGGIRLSHMTFPHAQAVMMLLEQLYRCEMIAKGSGYHH